MAVTVGGRLSRARRRTLVLLAFVSCACGSVNSDGGGHDGGTGGGHLVPSELCVAVCDRGEVLGCLDGSMATCHVDCERRTTCKEWRWYLECALSATGGGEGGCVDGTIFSLSCEPLLADVNTCPPEVTTCTPGTAKDCQCVPSGWGITYCEQNGHFGPCFNCKR